VLAMLGNPDLEAEGTIVSRRLALAESSFRTAQSEGRLEVAARQAEERNRLATALSVIQVQQAALVVRAPIAGIVATPLIEQRVGAHLDQGQVFITIADRRDMKARILVRDWEIEDIHVGAPVKLNVAEFPYHTYSGTVLKIMPATAEDVPVGEKKLVRYGQETTNFIAVVIDFPNTDGRLQEGLKQYGKAGEVKIYPGTPHAFFNDTRKDVYRPSEAKDAWTRVLEFFARHLKKK